MNFVVYCHIFQHICILFTVISIFYIDFWGFSNDPLYLGYNSAEQENPVLCIFDFQGPSRTQKDLGFFFGAVFHQDEGLEHLDLTRGLTRPERAPVAWHSRGIAPPTLVRPSDLWLPRFSCHRLCFDLKPSINKAPSRSREQAERKHRNTETEAEPGRLEGETPPESSPVASPPSPTSSSASPWWRGSSPPLDYGFVAVAWSLSLSLVLWLFRTIWAALHDYGHICNTYVVDLCFMRWYMRLQFLLCVWCIHRCILCTPFLSACSDQTCMQGRVRGNVCIRWSNMVVVIG